MLIHRHPPERGRSKSVTAACCGCCCCCCCLHTIGGLAGAIVSSRASAGQLREVRKDPDVAARFAVERKGVATYWWSLLALTVLWALQGLLQGLLQSDYSPVQSSLLGLFALLIFFPVVQLGASLLSFLIVSFSCRPDPGPAYRRIARITGVSLLWAILLAGLMIAPFLVAGGL